MTEKKFLAPKVNRLEYPYVKLQKWSEIDVGGQRHQTLH